MVLTWAVWNLEAGNLQDYINSFIYRKKNEESDEGGVGTWAAEPRLPSEGGECACARIPCPRIPPSRNSLLSTAYCVQSSSVYRFRPLPIANTFIGVDNLSFVLKVRGHKCCWLNFSRVSLGFDFSSTH